VMALLSFRLAWGFLTRMEEEGYGQLNVKWFATQYIMRLMIMIRIETTKCVNGLTSWKVHLYKNQQYKQWWGDRQGKTSAVLAEKYF
jgi:hypothetical protein